MDFTTAAPGCDRQRPGEVRRSNYTAGPLARSYFGAGLLAGGAGLLVGGAGLLVGGAGLLVGGVGLLVGGVAVFAGGLSWCLVSRFSLRHSARLFSSPALQSFFCALESWRLSRRSSRRSPPEVCANVVAVTIMPAPARNTKAVRTGVPGLIRPSLCERSGKPTRVGASANLPINLATSRARTRPRRCSSTHRPRESSARSPFP
jgi:hypothetical protein